MPTSVLELAPRIINMVWRRPHERVLDVGAGWGKYGVLLREYAAVPVVDAVEAWPPYIAQHRLGCHYDHVWADDVCNLPAAVLSGYDGVLMVDVIEHLEKQAAVDLLDRIPGWVVVCTPMEWFQNPEADAVPTEEHRSHWTVEDFGDRVDEDASGLGATVVALRPRR